MPRPDEGLIHAWLDGELDAAEAARVEKLVAEDAEWGAAAAEARGLVAASSRILGALDVVAGDVIPGGGRAAPAPDVPRIPTPQVASRWRRTPNWLRVAAGAVLVAGIGYLANRDGRAESGVMMVADSPSVAAPVAAREAVSDASAGAAASSPVREEAREARAQAGTRTAEPVASLAAPPAVAPPATPTAELARAAEDRAVTAESLATGRRAEAEALEQRLRSSDLRLEQVVVTGVPAASAAAGAPAAAPPPAPTPTAKRALAEAPAVAQKMAAGAGFATAPSNTATSIISGCWRVRTTGVSDTLLVTIPVLRQLGDSLVVRVTANGAEAKVRRERSTALGPTALTGTATTIEGATVPFAASVVRCPRD